MLSPESKQWEHLRASKVKLGTRGSVEPERQWNAALRAGRPVPRGIFKHFLALPGRAHLRCFLTRNYLRTVPIRRTFTAFTAFTSPPLTLLTWLEPEGCRGSRGPLTY